MHGFVGITDRRQSGVVMGHEIGGRVVSGELEQTLSQVEDRIADQGRDPGPRIRRPWRGGVSACSRPHAARAASRRYPRRGARWRDRRPLSGPG
ncbi:MAG: hypothetical protein ACYC1E_09365 [Propionibacteriaceae bacterium]